MLRPSNYRPPELKSARELALMREAGKLVVRALQGVAPASGDEEVALQVAREVLAAGPGPMLVGRALVLAAREAMTNAAKFAGVEEIDVYAEVTDDDVSVFVRDRGAGFDRAAVSADRRGVVESIEARMERAGGRATLVTSPGAGTEVELRLTRRAS